MIFMTLGFDVVIYIVMDKDPLGITMKIIIVLSVITVSFSVLGIGGFVAMVAGTAAAGVLIARKYSSIRTRGIFTFMKESSVF